jgi:putative DNA primase/helicase
MTEFVEAMMSAGINPPEMIVCDGKVRRFPVDGEKNKKSGWYVLFDDPPAGAFGCWKTGVKHTWCLEREMDHERRDEFQRKMEMAKRIRAKEDAAKKEKCRHRAERIWKRAQDGVPHGYLKRKKVGANGTRVDMGSVIVPVRDSNGNLHGLQFIRVDGSKKFLTGTAKKGCYFSIGQMNGQPLCIAEGFATAASIHECTRNPVAVAFDAGNLKDVALSLRGKFPDAAIIVCADNDKSGVGQQSAKDAALAVGGFVAIPPVVGMDFNDYHVAAGASLLSRIIGGAYGPV